MTIRLCKILYGVNGINVLPRSPRKGFLTFEGIGISFGHDSIYTSISSRNMVCVSAACAISQQYSTLNTGSPRYHATPPQKQSLA